MLWIAIASIGLFTFWGGIHHAARSNSIFRWRSLLGFALTIGSPFGLVFSGMAIGTVAGRGETSALQPLVGVTVPPETYAVVAPGFSEPTLLFHVSGEKHLTSVGLYHLEAYGLTIDSLAVGTPRIETITRTTPVDWRIPLLSFPLTIHDRVLRLPRGAIQRIEYSIQ